MKNEFVGWLRGAIHNIARTTTISTDVGEMIYDDGEGTYSLLIRPLDRSVSSVESFWQATVEEVRRRALLSKDENKSANVADFVTAVFTESGGCLYSDDAKGSGAQNQYHYKRKHSAPYEYLKDILSAGQRGFEHRELLKALQRFGPAYIHEYDYLMSLYRRVSFSAGTQVNSQPIVTDGTAGRSIEVTLTTKSGDMDTNLPGQINFQVPFVMGEADSARWFNVEVLVDMALDENSKPKFYLYAPRFEAEKERCILQEVEDFKEATAGLANLLILNSF